MKKAEIIDSKLLEIIKTNPGGIRYSDLLKIATKALSDQKPNYIVGRIGKLSEVYPSSITKPDMGWYYPVSVESVDDEETFEEEKPAEKDFYELFAGFFSQEVEQCEKIFPLGGAISKKYWYTPDIIGTNKYSKGLYIDAPTEVISIEIKTEPTKSAIFKGFGQVVTYKLYPKTCKYTQV